MNAQNLAIEFVQKVRAGESLSISEYCSQFPEQSESLMQQIRRLLQDDDSYSATVTLTSDSDKSDQENFPTQIANYRLIDLIGEGGMGTVYRAEHEGLGRHVALKLLSHHHATNKQAISRFEREARAIAKLHHSNIVPLFEVGEVKGQWFLAMQLIEGESLHALVASMRGDEEDEDSSAFDLISASEFDRELAETTEGFKSQNTIANIQVDESTASKLPSMNAKFYCEEKYREIASIGKQAAEALEYAHARGIVHRDVKPSNLLLDHNGVVWLSDFGLAKSEGEDVTQTGDFVGTVKYMAPEQFQGNSDARSDIYALGLTLYELLALRPAHAANDRWNLIHNIINSRPPRLRSIDRAIPRDLETIVGKAIDKDPAARYQSARELAIDLQRFITDEPIMARRHSPIELLARWSRRNKGLAVAIAGILLLATVMTIGAYFSSEYQKTLRKNAEDSRGAASKAERRAMQALTAAEEIQNKAKTQNVKLQRLLYASQMSNLGLQEPTKDNRDSMLARLNRWQPDKIDGQDFRGWEWFYLQKKFSDANTDGDENPSQLSDQSNSDQNFEKNDSQSFHNKVAKISEGTLVVSSIASSSSAKTLWQSNTNLSPALGLAWSNGGDRIATSHNGFLTIWNVDEGVQQDRFDDLLQQFKAIAWNQDGTRIAASSTTGVSIWDTRSGNVCLYFKLADVTNLSWSKDARKLMAKTNQSVTTWDAGEAYTKVLNLNRSESN